MRDHYKFRIFVVDADITKQRQEGRVTRLPSTHKGDGRLVCQVGDLCRWGRGRRKDEGEEREEEVSRLEGTSGSQPEYRE